VTEQEQYSDKRSRRWPVIEPLAMRAIRSFARSQGKPKATLRNLTCYYIGIIQIVAMNGSGCRVTNGLIEDFSGVSPNEYTHIRSILANLGLLSIKEEADPGGGGRKMVFIEVLDAPNADYPAGSRICSRETASPGQDLSVVEEVAGSGISSHKGTTKSSVVEPLLRKDSPTGASAVDVPPEIDSIADWGRGQIGRWHDRYPTDIPTTAAAAYACVLESMADWKRFHVVTNQKAYAIAKKFFGAGAGKTHGMPLAYRDWMDGLLSFTDIPKIDGEYKLMYFIQAVRHHAERCRISRKEKDHENRKRHGRPLAVGEQRVTDEDMKLFMESDKDAT